MLSYDDLVWTISFPAFCFLTIWFSITASLVMRAECGRKKRGMVQQSIVDAERKEEVVTGAQRRNSKAVWRRAVVVVGGDFARSPRMQYHALSLAKCGMFQEVVLVGFDMGNSLSEPLKVRGTKGNVDGHLDEACAEEFECSVETMYLISPITPPQWFRVVFSHPRLYWLASTFYRVCAFTVVFTWVLVRASMLFVNRQGRLLLVDLILVQSPPAVPFVPIVKYIVRPFVFLANAITYYCLILTGSWISNALKEIAKDIKLQKKQRMEDMTEVSAFGVNDNSRCVLLPALIVDWHNLGYTILRSDGRPLPAVWLYRQLECGLCFGDCNITVSKAMRRALLQSNRRLHLTNRGDDVSVLCDTAPDFFGPVPRSRFVEEVLLPVAHPSAKDCGELIGCSPPPEWVLRSTATADNCGLFIVASTSWTPDDDYSMVVDALKRVDQRLLSNSSQRGGELEPFKSVWLLVTGKGESRWRFEAAVAEAKLSSFVTVTTMYMQSYEHYAMALGAADVGLCMHNSSSGLDLPMKAVDMLGSGLPVVALWYESLNELLDDECGWFFSDAKQLERIIWKELLSSTGSLQRKRQHVIQSQRLTWDDNWERTLKPLLQKLL
uniref:Uncharacterized protein TCIL3000_10_11300 n=1 Tax=Trypanosoma congolense (strain IL3000) TaxID=1068625 RepID=G0UY84_TRYCI|nr:unnamed protein product [Trypanosoma congolense IL3000]